MGVVAGRLGCGCSAHRRDHPRTQKKRARIPVDEQARVAIEADKQVVWTRFNQNKTRLELKDYSVGEYVGQIRNAEDKRDAAHRRYEEIRQAYQLRFGEFYNPLDDLYGEVRDLDREKDIEFKKWDEERLASDQRLRIGCTIAWFVCCGLVFGLSVLVHWFSCSVLNWC